MQQFIAPLRPARHVTRTLVLCLVVSALLCTLLGLAGCGKTKEKYPDIVIGTLATEDILPMWVAESEDMFTDAGLTVTVQVFQSATELIAGITSGEVDYAMTDPMVAASIFAAGTNVRIEWITLGADASQGRFGLMTGPDSDITSITELRGKSVGVGSNTLLEYVLDCLLVQEGMSEDDIIKEELQKLPVRYQEMLAGQVDTAMLPASLLALGEANGCTLIADDTKGENLSQSVMISRLDFLGDKEGGAETLDMLKEIWNAAVKKVNDNPDDYRALLVEKANLSDAIADTYPMQTYPTCQLPTNDMIDPILAWMTTKGYLTVGVTYNETTGEFKPDVEAA